MVGGTGYYVNSLLSRRTVGEDSEDRNDLNQEQLEQRYAILKEPTEVILAELKRVDPLMARKWHPRDRRKISRSLAIYLQTGRPASAIYAEQKSDGGKESRGSVRPVEGKEGSTKEEAPEIEPRQPLSQFRSLILWPVISTSSLEGTLDARVEKMVQHGLLDEVDVLRRRHRWFSETRGAVDMTKGIWVAIGFKEFLKYAELKEGGTASQQELHEAYAQAVESTKIATRQYATRQTRWIRRKLLPLTRELNLANRIFLLDASGRDSWPNKVEQPALDLVFRFIQGEPLPRAEEVVADSEALLRSDTDGVDESGMDPIEEHCTICNVTAVLMKDWRAHLNSRTHKRREKVRALGNTKEQWIRKQQLRASQAEPDAPAEGAVGS